MTAPATTVADLTAWEFTPCCEVGRTMMRRRIDCDQPAEFDITRHDCNTKPPFQAESLICAMHLDELRSMPYPFVICSECQRTLPTFDTAVTSVRRLPG